MVQLIKGFNMAWRKWLSLVGALAGIGAGAGAGVPMLAGCTRGTGASPRITRENPFPFMPEQRQELCGTALSRRDDWTAIDFGELLEFNREGETINATAYSAVTFPDGRVFGGKYAMQATFVKGDSGGPAGSVTEYSVEVEGVRLVERMVKPQAPDGVKAILPGEFVVRKIPDGDVTKVNETYVVELPANKRATVVFEPAPEDYAFRVSVSKDGVSVPTAFVKDTVFDWGYRFDTATGGLFSILVHGGGHPDRIPYLYKFYVRWGDCLGERGTIRPDWLVWKELPASNNRPTNQHEQQKEK
jgi:hypothetical protein